MPSFQQLALIGIFFFIMTKVPQPYVTVYVAMFFIIGTILNKKDNLFHLHEKESLRQEIEKAKKEKHGDTPWHIILGVDETASLEECTKLRRLLSKIYHPDSGSAPNQKTMQRINNAYEERQQIEKSNENTFIS